MRLTQKQPQPYFEFEVEVKGTETFIVEAETLEQAQQKINSRNFQYKTTGTDLQWVNDPKPYMEEVLDIV